MPALPRCSVKRDLYVSKETYMCQKRPICVKRDLGCPLFPGVYTYICLCVCVCVCVCYIHARSALVYLHICIYVYYICVYIHICICVYILHNSGARTRRHETQTGRSVCSGRRHAMLPLPLDARCSYESRYIYM